MSEPARNLGFNWNNYRSWGDDQRWELIDGEPFAMAPAPTTRHQRILGNLFSEIRSYLKGKNCQAFPAPTDVRLSDVDVVQPDIVVVCNPDQIKRTHIEGPPTLVVEILSPGTEAFGRVRKMRLYAEKGVREVWLFTPYPWLAEVYLLRNGKYLLDAAYEKKDELTSPTFPELSVKLETIFDYTIPPEEQIDMVKEGIPPYPKKQVASSE